MLCRLYVCCMLSEGSLEVKPPTIWTDEKQRWQESEKRREEKRRDEKRREEKRREGKGREGKRREENRNGREEKRKEEKGREEKRREEKGREGKRRRKKLKKRKSQKKEDPGARKGGKVAKTMFFHWFEAPEGRKVGSLKRRVRCQLARWEMIIARRCGAKHISKSKCTKHTILGPLLEVEISKKCTPLWREAHLEVKMHKTHQLRSTFGSWDVGKVRAVVARSTFRPQNVQSTPAPDHFWKLWLWCRKVHAVVARSTFRSQNVKSTTCSDHFLTFRCRFAWQGQGIVHLVKSEQNVRVL